jgi:hypothetical protein
LEGAAAILSFFVLVINDDDPFGPMNFKMTNGGVHIVVTNKGPTSPQKLHDLRERVKCQLLNLDSLNSQDISESL